ncbi:hypothetical protein KI387_033728 [Taxus chinensis]|uniref:DYW domain-containing protein n=1 Tax=Taxus chinensis TaxID=29808 RepID=A0AA38BUB0_TAXCH|nr:hypothetical protein KI387_033728 [Taxus chinensis]
MTSDVVVGTALVVMYCNCRSIEIAREVFDKLSKRDVVAWSAMIAGYLQNGHAEEALLLFHQMQMADLNPNQVTILSLLPLCANLAAFETGSVGIAHRVFDKMFKRNMVSWTAMVAGYAQNGHAIEALSFFYQMWKESVEINRAAILSVLQAITELGALQLGKDIHVYAMKSGFDSDVSVGTALLGMYAKCGSIDSAGKLFDNMSTRDAVAWSGMIAGYAHNGYSKEALELFDRMQLTEDKPNPITLVSVVKACAHLGVQQRCKWIHDFIVRSGFESNVLVVTALIDMYAKCGRIEIARELFDNMPNKDVVSWSVIIAAYGTRCHAGLVDEGWQYFDCMIQEYCITPHVQHYACMVDLLGRARRLEEAQDFIKRMPIEPDVCVWGAFLSACRIHCNTELGAFAAKKLFDLNPENAGYYILLSNIYAAAGRWDDIVKVRQLMKDRGWKKTPGCSWIEVNNRIHSFLVGDRSHPQSENIYAILESMFKQMKEMGYVPDMDFVLHDVEDELKEDLLSCHSEKLAIAFGILNTRPGTPIRITKNLRVCTDCHTATKFITKIFSREIIMRDANRFHHIKDGLCSCSDYW